MVAVTVLLLMFFRTSLFTLSPYMIAVNSTIIDVLHPTVNSFIGGVKVSMLALSVVGCGFGP